MKKRSTRVMTENVESSELARANVELTANENDLVSLLVEAAEPYGTTVRLVGGWVRDKALGRVTKDVDVAVDNCSGAEFAERVVAILAARSVPEEGSKIGVIAANPEQSKHLETATMRLCGAEVDFVNLRSERYADNFSRVPTSVEFGTPEEDALRRDFTLNALFFNAHTRTIEDWTGKGWEDLRAGVLRTPLDSRVTLLDDPLRALRGVRFAARYGFNFDPSFRRACADPEVRGALLAKVSRERVGKELKGALSTKSAGAVRAVQELGVLGLAPAALTSPQAVVFEGEARALDKTTVPVDQIYPEGEQSSARVWRLSARCVSAHHAVAFRGLDDAAAIESYQQDRYGGWISSLALMLAPLADCRATIGTKKNNVSPLPEAVCRDGLKLHTKEKEAAQALISATPVCRDLAERCLLDGKDAESTSLLRRDAGVFLFDMKDKWRAAFAVARARDLADLPSDGGDDLLVLERMQRRTEYKTVIDKYDKAVQTIVDLSLDHVWSTYKPHFDGKAIISELHVPKGPLVGKIANIQRDFILQNPEANAATCKAVLEAEVAKVKQQESDSSSHKKRRH